MSKVRALHERRESLIDQVKAFESRFGELATHKSRKLAQHAHERWLRLARRLKTKLLARTKQK